MLKVWIKEGLIQEQCCENGLELWASLVDYRRRCLYCQYESKMRYLTPWYRMWITGVISCSWAGTFIFIVLTIRKMFAKTDCWCYSSNKTLWWYYCRLFSVTQGRFEEMASVWVSILANSQHCCYGRWSDEQYKTLQGITLSVFTQ